MKRKISLVLLAVVCIAIALSAMSCAESNELWTDATYTSDKTVGKGANRFAISVEANGKTVVLTVNTDKDNVGDALYELGLINDAEFFDVLNGIKADWNKDHAYWSFYIDDAYASHGVKDEKLPSGSSYKFVYTK